MTDTTTKVREHYSAMGLTDRIKSAVATLAPEGQTLTVGIGHNGSPEKIRSLRPGTVRSHLNMW